MTTPPAGGLAAVLAILQDGRPRTPLQLQAQLYRETGRLYRLDSLGALVRRLRGQVGLETMPVYRHPRQVAYRVRRAPSGAPETGG